MTKVKKAQQKSESRLTSPHSLRLMNSKITKASRHKKQKNASEKKEWRDAKCSVCLEYPHNAVLLLCSSHDKGCRSYMCATSCRYSNCLEQYKKAYTKVNPTGTYGSVDEPRFRSGSEELLCPLCRGQVKGWTVVKRARRFLNSKKRSCMQENCLFVGSYKDLRKHVRADHPSARPREVDPTLAKKWKKLETDRELEDVRSTIRSTMPGSIIVGDYVIDSNYYDTDDYSEDDSLDDVFLRTATRSPYFGRGFESSSSSDYSDSDSDSDGGIVGRTYISRIGIGRRRQAWVPYGGSRRRIEDHGRRMGLGSRRRIEDRGRRMGLGSRRRRDA